MKKNKSICKLCTKVNCRAAKNKTTILITWKKFLQNNKKGETIE